MRIIQWVSRLNLGDAIGNDTLALDVVLKKNGLDARIMCLQIHPALQDRAELLDMQAIRPEDLVIFHKASGEGMTKYYYQLPCKRVVIYHNITPARFFASYDWVMTLALLWGRRQLKKMAACTDWAWGDSLFNCRELKAAGYREDRIRHLPIMLDITPDPTLADQKKLAELKERPGTRFLFVGRVAPNKKQEDIIKLFAVYQKKYDPQARLVFIGSHEQGDKYYAKLRGFLADLKLQNVEFTGHITDGEMNAYYRAADVFVCMSEHEGFCVPVIEAEKYDIPVLAYESCAVPETLGNNGLLFAKKDYEAMADTVYKLMQDAAYREQVIATQRAELARFSPEKTEARFMELLREAMENEK